MRRNGFHARFSRHGSLRHVLIKRLFAQGTLKARQQHTRKTPPRSALRVRQARGDQMRDLSCFRLRRVFVDGRRHPIARDVHERRMEVFVLVTSSYLRA
jgi:hypothetical protein